MVYAAIAVALFGVTAGAVFRLKVLLVFVGIILVAAVIFSFFRSFSFLETALTIAVAESILQGAYFVGLVLKSLCPIGHRIRRVI